MRAGVKTRVGYEEDLYAWTREQAALLRAHRTEGLDWDHLAEELESMVGRDRRELKNRLRVILLASPEVAGATCAGGARAGARASAPSAATSGTCCKQSPSLRQQVSELMREAYADAVKDAVDETGLPADRFPADCPYAPTDALAEDYLPRCQLLTRRGRGALDFERPARRAFRCHEPRRPRRHSRARPDARPRGALLHPDPGRPRRRGDQGRTAAGRRGARLGAAVRRGGRRFVLHRHQSQQALARPRPRPARGARGAAPSPGARRRPDRELQAGRHGEDGASATRTC